MGVFCRWDHVVSAMYKPEMLAAPMQGTARRRKGMSIQSPASKLVAMTQGANCGVWPRNGSRPGGLTADHRGRKGASQGGCDGGPAGGGHGRALQKHDGRAVGRSIGREGEVGGVERASSKLVVVVVMVLSRARQCSEERDFGNEWPDGRAPVCCTVKSSVGQIRASFRPLGWTGEGLGLAFLVAFLAAGGRRGGWPHVSRRW